MKKSIRKRVDAAMKQDRPFKDADTAKLKFALRVGEAGLAAIWDTSHPDYAKCEVQVRKMREELKLRGVS